ncbi:MAG: 16S rRNA (cytosine(1402)-N(4))-methyltransferase, partial [Flavobacteriales bacterium]
MEKYHQPALLNESMDALCIDPDGIVVDATFGGGGHSREILKRLNKGRLIAFDQDPDAAGNAIDDERFLLLRQNFRYLKNNLKYCKAIPIQALIADIGLSSHQVNIASKGFSMNDASPLDMRMNPGQKTTAAFILNNSDEEKLTKILSEYGEVPGAHKVARA